MSEQGPDRPRARPSGPRPLSEVVGRLGLERNRANAPRPGPIRPGRIITGRLEAHGSAKYQFRPDGSPSYYVKIVSSRGVETLWGVDLERAIKRSTTKPKIGSTVGVQRVGSELVALPAGARQRTARRAQWLVENITFFADAMQRARRDRETQLADSRELRRSPELRSAYISLHATRKFADEHIHNSHDRELFVARVKALMTLSAREGTPIPEPRVIERQRKPNREVPTR